MHIAASLFFSFALLGAFHVMFALVKSHGTRIVSALAGETGRSISPIAVAVAPHRARTRTLRRLSQKAALPLAA